MEFAFLSIYAVRVTYSRRPSQALARTNCLHVSWEDAERLGSFAEISVNENRTMCVPVGRALSKRFSRVRIGGESAEGSEGRRSDFFPKFCSVYRVAIASDEDNVDPPEPGTVYLSAAQQLVRDAFLCAPFGARCFRLLTRTRLAPCRTATRLLETT